MARSEGSRNRDYEQRRRDILVSARQRLGLPGGSRASLRELAEAAGVSLPTLRHYFPSRQALILAVLALARAEGEIHLRHLAMPDGPLESSIRSALNHVAFGFRHGVGELHTVGLTEGLRDPVLGPGFITSVLEPSIDALALRLRAHIASGEMVAADTRSAAIQLLSPIILLMLHQSELGGASSHPIDLDRFIDDQASAFVRAFGTIGKL